VPVVSPPALLVATLPISEANVTNLTTDLAAKPGAPPYLNTRQFVTLNRIFASNDNSTFVASVAPDGTDYYDASGFWPSCY
jgi:hypothetical protein